MFEHVRFASSVAILLCVAVVGFVRAQATEPPPKAAEKATGKAAGLESLGWLEGRWVSREDGYTEETWNAPAGGSMLGMCRIGEDAKRVMYEIMLIEETADGLVLRLRHYGPKLAPREKGEAQAFRAVEHGEKRIMFETQEDAGPVRLVYAADGADQLSIRLEKMQAGKTQAMTFRLKRAS